MTTTDPAAGSQPTPAPKRKSPMRIIVRVLLVLGLVIVVGLIVLYVNLNSIVRRQVEVQSANSLNVPTKLGGANVSLFGGEVVLKDFQVGSPQGFKEPQMMTLGGIDVSVKLSELRSDPIRVSEINIKDPRMVIEMQGTAFNIKKFIDSLPPGEDKPTDNGKPPMKLVIGSLKVNGAQVVLKPDLAALSAVPGIGQNLGGLKQEYVLAIPPLDMQNVGSGEGNQNGAAIKEIVSLLVTQLAAKASQSDQLPPELRQVLSLNVNDITNMLKAKIGAQVDKQLGKITQDLSSKIGGDAGKTLGDILKNSTGGAAGSPTTGAATTQPNPTQAIEQGLGNLLNKKKR